MNGMQNTSRKLYGDEVLQAAGWHMEFKMVLVSHKAMIAGWLALMDACHYRQ